MKFLIFSGSFHSKSRTLMIVQAVKNHLAAHDCEVPQLNSLPFYSEDLNADRPANVKAFLQTVAACDGLICVTPEYNHSIPAVLKNAIDWASRPAFKSPLTHKPVTVITQADNGVGGARTQEHLKLVFDSTLSPMLLAHEMMIANVSKAVNANGEITDSDVQRRLARHLDHFVAFVEQSKK